jgi:hypothetical protein
VEIQVVLIRLMILRIIPKVRVKAILGNLFSMTGRSIGLAVNRKLMNGMIL